MTNTAKKRTNIAQMTLLAMLVAVLIVLAFVNIPMPMGLSITFNMIPVAIAVMAMGMKGGLIIGGAFGLISFLQCFGICGSSALGAALVSYNPFLMFVQRFVSRVLVGALAAKGRPVSSTTSSARTMRRPSVGRIEAAASGSAPQRRVSLTASCSQPTTCGTRFGLSMA